MRNRTSASTSILLISAILLSGCRGSRFALSDPVHINDPGVVHTATSIEMPTQPTPFDQSTSMTVKPATLSLDEPIEHRDLSLHQAVQLALVNSRVLRDLGGTVLRAPEAVRTVHDPAIQEADPRFGVEAALAAFDASFAASAFWENNDRAINNTFLGGGTRLLKQDNAVYQSELSKTAVTGTEFKFRNYTQYDSNNAPGNTFTSAWDLNFEAEVRHPLLQGGGSRFNRIAGLSETPGIYNGVLIARTSSDITLADFEQRVTQFVSDVENAYWDLYFAYRDLDARIQARDAALQTWRRVRALYEAGRRGGEAEKEAQARERYYQYQADVENALSGRLVDRTQAFNGSAGGTFRGEGGVLTAERRLRLMIGMPINEGVLLRPSDDPVPAEISFEWDMALAEALARRVEIRKQKWVVEQRELECEASRNFLLPELDVVGRYRVRGFGNDLFRQHDGEPLNTAGVPVPGFNNAYDVLNRFDFQDLQAGVELTVPLGYRRAHAAVRHAEHRLARERAILREQEREVAHNLSNAINEKDRARRVAFTMERRRNAARQQYDILLDKYENENLDDLDQVLQAQQRYADAEVAWYQALIEYAVAVKNVQFEKGSLLDYNQVFLSEGPWPHKAYHDAADTEATRGAPETPHNCEPPVAAGPAPQLVVPLNQ